jgi:multicomponent Na+:H+ antiporter subunit C
MPDAIAYILAKYNYWMAVILMMIGLYAMIAKKNLIKKIVGMNIFQTAIILFYISIGFKKGGTIPILEHNGHVIDVAKYSNPLPHVLMLTAIVVSVSTFGVALALAIKIYQEHGTLEENEILSELEQ